MSLLFKFVNFAVLLLILYRFAKRPLREYLLRRHGEIKERLDEARRRLEEAEALKREYEQRMERLDEEIEEFKRRAREEVEREKERLQREATAYIESMRTQIRLAYEQELREMEERVRKEVVRLTLKKAERLIAERVGENEHRTMVNEFIEYLRGLN
jgi:F-type H+-transporting ATPase subunit b